MKRFDNKACRAFIDSLPEDDQDECFEFFEHRFCIPVAKFLISRGLATMTFIPVKTWAERLGLNHGFNPGVISILTGVDDYNLLWSDFDTTVPVIILEVAQSAWYHPLLIDGNHRLRKAFLLEQERLPAYLIPQEYQKLIEVK